MNGERKTQLQQEIAGALEREDFCNDLFTCEEPEKFHCVLAKYGISADISEIEELVLDGKNALNRMKTTGNDELSLEQLESIAGGSKFWRGVASVAGGAALGFGLGMVCGACPAFTPAAYKIAVGYSVAAGVWVVAG